MKKRAVLNYQKNIISSKQVIDYRIWDYGLPGKIHPDMPGEERNILIPSSDGGEIYTSIRDDGR